MTSTLRSAETKDAAKTSYKRGSLLSPPEMRLMEGRRPNRRPRAPAGTTDRHRPHAHWVRQRSTTDQNHVHDGHLPPKSTCTRCGTRASVCRDGYGPPAGRGAKAPSPLALPPRVSGSVPRTASTPPQSPASSTCMIGHRACDRLRMVGRHQSQWLAHKTR